MRESLLEPVLRKMRISRVLPVLRGIPHCHLLDIGCGREAKLLSDVEPYIARGVGIDFKAPIVNTGKLTIVQSRIDGALPFENDSFDVVTMLAVLEHLEKQEAILAETLRVLRPGGFFAGTVPSKIAKPFLEFLSFKVGIVNPDEIRDHKRYYDKSLIHNVLKAVGFTQVKHTYFQFGMNNFFTARKQATSRG